MVDPHVDLAGLHRQLDAGHPPRFAQAQQMAIELDVTHRTMVARPSAVRYSKRAFGQFTHGKPGSAVFIKSRAS